MLIISSNTTGAFETSTAGSTTTRRHPQKKTVLDALSVTRTAMTLPDDDVEGGQESRASDKAPESSYDPCASAADLLKRARSCFMSDMGIASDAILSDCQTGTELEKINTANTRMNDLSELIQKYEVVLDPKSQLNRDKSDYDIDSLNALNEKANGIMGPSMARQRRIVGVDRRPPLAQGGAPW